jgi:hypothetical protein
MITQVSGFNTKGVANDLRQSARTMRPEHNSNLSNQINFRQENPQQPQKSPIWTGTSIVLGSVLFMMIYLLISGTKRA